MSGEDGAMQAEGDQDYVFGRFYLDTRERVLLCDGKAVPMTLKAFNTLFVLVQSSGHIVEKGELMKQVWPNAFVEEANITQHVYKLRRVLGVSPDGSQYIETIPRRGYRFTTAITLVKREDAAPVMQRGADGTTQPADNISMQSRLGTPNISLAVLPFAHTGSQPGAEYLGDAITECLISMLAESTALRIMSGTTVSQYKYREVDPLQIGRDLNVWAVVTGRVLQIGDALLIKVEMIDTIDGSCLWYRQYTSRTEDIFKVQEAILRTISDRLQIKINHEVRIGSPVENPKSPTTKPQRLSPIQSQ